LGNRGGRQSIKEGAVKAAPKRLIPILALALVAASCRKSGEPAAGGRESGYSQPATIERHTLRGVVREVDAARSQITVEHEEIPGYMSAMTMPFPVRDDPRVVGLLRSGDRIEATLAVDKDKNRYWLEKVLTKGFVPTAATAAARASSSAVTPQPNRAVGAGELVPDFALTDQTGKTLRLSELRGEPVALTFLYTRCPIATACPLTAAKFSKLDQLLAAKHFGRLLTITVDPENDTPQVLADYAKKVGADPKRWSFLTGSPAAVARVASDFGVLFFPDHGQITHSLAVAVVGPDGKLATIYYGDTWQAEHIFRDMEKARAG
jgi:protein SCO1/2